MHPNLFSVPETVLAISRAQDESPWSMIESNSRGRVSPSIVVIVPVVDQLFDSLFNPFHIMNNRARDFSGDEASLPVVGPVCKGSSHDLKPHLFCQSGEDKLPSRVI